MQIYRLQKAKYTTREAVLSGEGAYRTGGRWNLKGTPLVYTAESVALAILEILVHTEGELPPLMLTTLEIPNSILEIDSATLPIEWNKLLPPISAQLFTQKWLTDRQFLCMKVPSTVALKSNNYLINPRHELIDSVRIVEVLPLNLDSRLDLS